MEKADYQTPDVETSYVCVARLLAGSDELNINATKNSGVKGASFAASRGDNCWMDDED